MDYKYKVRESVRQKVRWAAIEIPISSMFSRNHPHSGRFYVLRVNLTQQAKVLKKQAPLRRLLKSTRNRYRFGLIRWLSLKQLPTTQPSQLYAKPMDGFDAKGISILKSHPRSSISCLSSIGFLEESIFSAVSAASADPTS